MIKRWMYGYAPVLLSVIWYATSYAASACPPTIAAPIAADFHAAMQNAKDRGVLWRFEKDGRYGYLYGTIHLGKLDWVFPGRTIIQALRDAAVIALEIDLLDPKVQQEMSAPQAATDRPELSAALWNRLRIQATKACIPWEQLNALAPISMALQLSMLESRWDGLDAGYANEFFLAGFARTAGKDLVMLESVAEQRRVLLDRPSAEQLVAIEGALTAMEAGNNREVSNAIADGWARGDLDQLERYGERCDAESQRSSFSKICERNAKIVERIDALHERGQRIFAAVGILHMVQESALPKLLEGRGFRVERVVFEPL